MSFSSLGSPSEEWASNPSSSSPSVSSQQRRGSLNSSTARDSSSRKSSHRRSVSAIQRRHTSALEPVLEADHTSSREVLGERDPNNLDSNDGKRGKDVPRESIENAVDPRGRNKYRTVSSSAFGTVAHGTIQQKSQSSSPPKSRQQFRTPEWKRRLLHGKVGYGEKTDLFSPSGLERIFRPPPSRQARVSQPSPFKDGDYIPSSPPEVRSKIPASEEDLDRDKENESPTSAGFSSPERSLPSPRPAATHVEKQRCSDLQDGSNRGSVQRELSSSHDETHEKISPIFISKHNTTTGAIDFAAFDSPAKQLQREWSGIQSNDDYTTEEKQQDRSVSASDLAPIGDFVNLKRGEESEDSAFYRRKLSESSVPFNNDSVLDHGSSFDQSTLQRLPRIQEADIPSESENEELRRVSAAGLRTPPRTPQSSPQRDGDSRSKSKGSGSPLKLFGAYDTYTNNKLLRRMSQFEDTFQEEGLDEDDLGFHEGLGSPSPHRTRFSKCGQANTAKDTKSNGNLERNFGKGHLDEYEFLEEYKPPKLSVSGDKSRGSKNRVPSLPNVQEEGLFYFEAESNVYGDLQPTRRRSSGHTKRKIRVSSRGSSGSETVGKSSINRLPVPEISIVQEQPENSWSTFEKRKRAPLSPYKIRTPKRLRKREVVSYGQSLAQLNTETSQTSKSYSEQEGRYVLYTGNMATRAEPRVLADRKISRPRNPTPSSRAQKAAGTKGETKSCPRIQASEGKDDPAGGAEARRLTASLAALTVDEMQKDNRKVSITTQDFFDEGHKIMDFIRTKGRPNSGLDNHMDSVNSKGGITAAEDREILNEEAAEADVEDDQSTIDNFSRPPSREGRAYSREPKQPKQIDPAIQSHLEKFAEPVEGDRMNSSSIGLPSSLPFRSRPASGDLEDVDEEQNGAPLQDGSRQEGLNIDSSNSNQTSGTSSSRTVHSSQSETRRTITQDKISHLIPEEVAGMVYDDEKKAWVKRKSSAVTPRSPDIAPPSEESEEDPFKDIPDLSDDALQHQVVPYKEQTEEEDAGDEQDVHEDDEQGDAEMASRSSSRSNSSQKPQGWSSTPARNMRSSERQVETRATSWGDEYKDAQAKETLNTYELPEHITEENETGSDTAEHEIQAHEGRHLGNQQRATSNQRRRSLTVTFSSPPEMGSNGYNRFDVHQVWSDADDHIYEDSGVDAFEELEQSFVSHSSKGRGPGRGFSQTPFRSSLHVPPRRISVGGLSFQGRPISRIDEHTEEHASPRILSGNRPRSNSQIVLATPRSVAGRSSLPPPPTTAQKSNVTFHLSPLPDFTVHGQEESLALELDHLAKLRGDRARSSAQASLSYATEELVKHLTDEEPHEPYWEQIRGLELRTRSLPTLYKLDEFCSSLETLDVSGNHLGHLTGLPSTIRRLNVSNNRLSNLTNWSHLRNLQYLDVSGNNIESVEGFRPLIHLRELKADGNAIFDLDGIAEIDGLMVLSVQKNRLTSISFEDSRLQYLTELNLSGNQINAVSGLQKLKKLAKLDLSCNELEEFSLHSASPMRSLQILRLEENRLHFIDISMIPNLRALHLDRNSLFQVHGMDRVRRLDTLSMREQTPKETHTRQGSPVLDLDPYHEVRRLYLSGSILPSPNEIHLSKPCLNLQSLELSSLGLSSLPPKFGLYVPNLRSLNLNFNAISDLRPLLGAMSLRKLHLAQNRISELRRTAKVLSRLRTLTHLDLRDNPLTQGFYPPITETRIVHQDVDEHDRAQEDSFTLPDVSHPLALSKDEKFRLRLDPSTKLRRRVYEVLFSIGKDTNVLRLLDGRKVNKKEITKHDATWSKLIEMGVLRKTKTNTTCKLDTTKHSQTTEPNEDPHASIDA